MSVKSATLGDTHSLGSSATGEVHRSGYLKKLKTMRKKFFVLRAESPYYSARLEYFDSEKKYRQNPQNPKRSIPLKACFNINRRQDTKHKYVIALYTKDDCFCVVLDAEKELEEWLKALLQLQRGEEVVDGEIPKPTFEHVWQVRMLDKGLGSSRNIRGNYHLCLTEKTLSLVRKSGPWHHHSHHGNTHHQNQQNQGQDHIEFSLMSIRRCGHSECFFYMEVGRSAITGAGELWMQTEDTNIAQNMDEVILRAMSNNNSKDEGRARANSYNEASKPISMINRRPTISGSQMSKLTNYSSPNNQDLGSGVKGTSDTPEGASGQANAVNYVNTTPNTGLSAARERCDSLPTQQRNRTSSECCPLPHPVKMNHFSVHRPQSLYRDISHSPPAAHPGSPACSTDSAGSSLSIDEPDACFENYTEASIGKYGHSMTPDEPIQEENMEDYMGSPPYPHAYVPMAPLSSDDGYVDMSPRGQHMSSAASSCSITSGTPSTDMRFSEYHLEKVSSYLASEEDDTSSERPIRAYSVGSRPEMSRFKKPDHSGYMFHENRVRAFSVGSRQKGLPNRILPPHGHPPTSGTKSSSAPLLNQNNYSGSHSSMEPMDDLMEMDFSRTSINNSGYVDMSPKNSRNSGYVEMKPGIIENCGTPEMAYMDMKPSISPIKSIGIHQDSVYMDMKPGSSPLKPATSPMQCPASSRDSGYMEMKPSTSPHKYNKYPYYVEMTPGCKTGTSPKSNKTASPIQEEYMNMEFDSRYTPTTSHDTKKSPEGYMDMSFGKTQRRPSEDHKRKDRRSSKKEKIAKNERSQPIAINRTVSIGAVTTTSSAFPTYTVSPGLKSSSGNSPKPPNFLPLVSTSYSPGSSPFSSLKRQRSRKNSRRDSKDSIGLTPTSDQSTIFPFSPGSPEKPFHIKSPDLAYSRKCAVDASSGTVKIAPLNKSSSSKLNQEKPNRSDYMEMGFEKPEPVYASQNKENDNDYINFCPARPKTTSTSSDDYGEYAIMRPMTLNEQRRSIPNIQSAITTKLSGLTMNLKANVFKPIVEPKEDRLGTVSPKPGDVAPHRSYENLRSNTDSASETSRSDSLEGNYETLRTCISPKLSRPGSVNSDKKTSRPSSVSSDKSNVSRPSSVSSEVTKGTLSRPSSVSSELGSTTSTIVGSRPESCNAELMQTNPSEPTKELHYASLDLAPAEDDGTRSPRNKGDLARSPTPSSSEHFTYAEIDFIKSEGMKKANIKIIQ